jgi:hypothetical protein
LLLVPWQYAMMATRMFNHCAIVIHDSMIHPIHPGINSWSHHTPSFNAWISFFWLVLHDVGESHFNFNHIQTLVSPMKPLFEILLVRSQNKAIMGYN